MKVLKLVGCYLFTLLSVIPSSVMVFSFNLYAFAASIMLILAILVRADCDEYIDKMISKHDAIDIKKSPRQVSLLWLPMSAVMIGAGHWIIGIFLCIIWALVFGMMSTAVSKIEK